jgi:MFS family permease
MFKMMNSRLAIINWSLASFFCVFQFFLQASSSLMAKLWSDDFHLSPIGVSSLSSAFFYTYLLMQIPVGFLNDLFNPRWILSSGAALIGVGCFILASTDQYSMAWFARFIMGLGSSFGFVSMLYISAEWFKAERFTVMVGYAETIGMVGVALSSVMGAALISYAGWRLTMMVSAVVALITLVLCIVFVRASPKPSHLIDQKNGSRNSLIKNLKTSLLLSLKNRNVWLSGLFGFCHFSVINALCSLWGVPFLRHVYHYSLSLSAAVISMIFYGMAIGAPLTSHWSVRLGRRKPIMALSSSLAALLLSLVIFVPNLSTGSLFILFFVIGVFASTYVQCYSITKELTPKSTHGVSLALTNLLVMLGAPLYQFLIANLLEHYSYSIAIAVVPLSFVLALGLIYYIPETYCRSGD